MNIYRNLNVSHICSNSALFRRTFEYVAHACDSWAFTQLPVQQPVHQETTFVTTVEEETTFVTIEEETTFVTRGRNNFCN